MTRPAGCSPRGSPPSPLARAASGAARAGSPRAAERAGGSARSPRLAAALAAARAHRAVLAVLAAYAGTLLVVPVLAPVAVSDDWTYTRSVEVLLREGRLEILDIAGATAIPQILWGGLFGLVGEGAVGLFGALRLATFTFVAGSAAALYLLTLELGVRRDRAALAVALYLANPVLFALGYTFMTDPYYVGLLVVSSWLFARGLRERRPSAAHTVLGSAVAGLAILQRVLGVLIPVAVVAFLLARRRLHPDRAGVLRFLQVVGIPLLAFLGLQAWLQLVHGVSPTQESFADSVLEATWEEVWLLVRRLGFIQLMYVGLFVLPLACGGLLTARRAVRRLTTGGWLVTVVVVAAVAAGLSFFAADGRLMPYVPHFLQASGVGPNDLVVGRDDLLGTTSRTWLTYACAASAVLFTVALAGRLRGGAEPAGDHRSARSLCLWLAGFQLLAVLLPSFAFRDWTSPEGLPAPSLDRYLLPLLPFAACLAALAWEDLPRRAAAVSWVAVATVGAFSTVGMHDQLQFQRATWDLAAWAVERGVEPTELDGGFAWHGYHLYGLPPEEGNPPAPDAPWWITAFAPVSDSSYVIAAEPLPDYHVVHEQRYDAWLRADSATVYLQRRPGVAGPP